MRRSRDNNRGSAYEEYLRDRQAELDEEQRQRDAAAANDPAAIYAATADAEAQAIRDTILNHRISESLLPGERVNGRKINEDVAASNLTLWAQQESTFQRYMFETFYAALKRNDLAPIANNFGALHRLLLQYAAYPDEPVQEAAPVVEEPAQPVLTPSEQAVIDHQIYCEKIIGHDESGKGWTMQEVDALPSKEMLRLLRLFEQGHRGSNLLTIRREVLDIKAQQDAERNRIAQEER